MKLAPALFFVLTVVNSVPKPTVLQAQRSVIPQIQRAAEQAIRASA